MKKNKEKVPNLVTLAILTTITVIFWVFFNIYREFTAKPAPIVPSELLESFSPKLDTEALDKLEKRFFYEGTIPLSEITVPVLTPSPQETPSPTPTPSPSPQASPEASPGLESEGEILP